MAVQEKNNVIVKILVDNTYIIVVQFIANTIEMIDWLYFD